MESVTRLMILLSFAFACSCKKWDPNKQYSFEMSAIDRLTSVQNEMPESNPLIHLEVGQSLSEVIKIIGNNYRILASLKNEESNWLRIEFFNHLNASGKYSERTELLFKDNLLLQIHKI